MSAATTMYHAQAPHRKPLPGYNGPSAMPAQPVFQQQPYQHVAPVGGPTVNGSRQYSMASQQGYAGDSQPARRTLSNATSTSSASTNTGLQRAPTTSAFSTASAPRRSTSSRSTSSASPTSYVALMRKQKATVWCDRAQHEDPRILAAQRSAKMRAAMEVAGGHHNASLAGRTSTSSSGMVGGVRSKIRHHGAPKASTYTGGPNLGGAGVPMRLSASEVDEGDSDEEPGSAHVNKYHSRTGSGRSSLGSGHRGQSGTYLTSGRGYSNGSTPPSGHSPVESMGDLLEEETPVPNSQYSSQSTDYFQQSGGQGGSGSSGEQEQQFGGVSKLPEKSSNRLEANRKTSEELRRRGSVDDRTMTMGGGRLFVANPDLSD
ncbi:hypothetical protein LTR91_007596 [Friedmanniomyces endolithicus]|uniref:Uncharacterized protein n=1 Tax=Friedmanniomyces endolithicus TaxID=329885 RepID=A0AAN6KPU9_9PEZI|nr:hypothetical protein LTR94_003146 [Friedmanniomyces endolithicus]KAK0813795.1 hypothetical protein LTR59_000950 [Friedmanniomyces endolithicus]KAK0814771.1 hypothetical protein LTR38_002601 [Friedmanniomyces endolithicus]KAK0815047.1 hypothetical protein LTR75_004048 [Friedmanniomyces endolithicus]KAK0851981.1 hypothetical protein LTR03_003726 [Friedmanniomyces endolithicus]